MIGLEGRGFTTKLRPHGAYYSASDAAWRPPKVARASRDDRKRARRCLNVPPRHGLFTSGPPTSPPWETPAAMSPLRTRRESCDHHVSPKRVVDACPCGGRPRGEPNGDLPTGEFVSARPGRPGRSSNEPHPLFLLASLAVTGPSQGGDVPSCHGMSQTDGSAQRYFIATERRAYFALFQTVFSASGLRATMNASLKNAQVLVGSNPTCPASGATITSKRLPAR